jgi:hypothetical protein
MSIMPVQQPQAGFKMAGSYLDPFSLINSPEYQKASDADKTFMRDYVMQKGKSVDPAGERLIDWAISQSTPEARQKILEQQLAFDKARGEQQMKYRMTNDIIGNLGQAARAAFGGYGVSPDYMGQAIGGAGNAYLAGSQAIPRVAPQVATRFF